MNRIAAALAVVALMAAAVLSTLGSRLPFLAGWMRQFHALIEGATTNWLLFLGLQIAAAAAGFVPASLMAMAAGAAYGLYLGFLLSSIGLMVGGSLAFLLSRSALAPWIERWVVRHPRFEQIDRTVSADGWRFVGLIRLSPAMPFALTSYCLGLTRIDFVSFNLGTLASLPALACFVAIGALGRTGWQMGTTQLGYVHGALLVVGVIATFLVAWRIQQLLRRSVASEGGEQDSR
jgi:uncharacterized membrane protein YdjX (TVP38/TMEM64 family)